MTRRMLVSGPMFRKNQNNLGLDIATFYMNSLVFVKLPPASKSRLTTY